MKMHTCSYDGALYPDTDSARFEHNTSARHKMAVLVATGAPVHVLRQAAEDAEYDLHDALDTGKITYEQYEAAFKTLPHIDGTVAL